MAKEVKRVRVTGTVLAELLRVKERTHIGFSGILESIKWDNGSKINWPVILELRPAVWPENPFAMYLHYKKSGRKCWLLAFHDDYFEVEQEFFLTLCPEGEFGEVNKGGGGDV